MIKFIQTTSLMLTSTLFASESVDTTSLKNVREEAKSEAYAAIDLLCWRTKEDGRQFCFKGISFLREDRVIGKLHHFSPSTDPGVRLELGTHFKKKNVTASISWTHINAQSAKTLDGTLSDQLNIAIGTASSTYRLPNTPPTTRNFARGKWSLEMNLVDGELLLPFNMQQCKQVTLSPYFGFRYAKIDQKIAGKIQGNPYAGAFNTQTSSQKHDYDGIGLRAGLYTEWNFLKHLSLVGKIAFSLLHSEYKLRMLDEYKVVGPGGFAGLSDIPQKICTGKFATDLKLGIMWKSILGQGNRVISIKAQWEQLLFHNHSQFILSTFYGNSSIGPPTYKNNRGDLSFHGLTLSACYEF